MERVILRILSALGVGTLLLLLKKPPFKDWVIVYLLTGFFSGIVDRILIAKNLLQYPVRFLPNFFNIHIIFDYVLCPTISVMYNQLTYKSKPMGIFLKIFLFNVPQVLIENWAEGKTNLIKWSKKWRWYHTFSTMTIKYLMIRLLMGLIRIVTEVQDERMKEADN